VIADAQMKMNTLQYMANNALKFVWKNLKPYIGYLFKGTIYMKKILLLFIVGILILNGLGAVALDNEKNTYKISESIHFSEPTIKQNDRYITINIKEAASSTMETGKPVLPKHTIVYTFPFGTRITNVEVLFSETIEQEISRSISPAPEPQIVSSTYKSNHVAAPEIAEAYSNIEIYPDSIYSYRTGSGLKDGENVIYLTVHLYPIQYSPSSNMIYYYKNAIIDLTYTSPKNPINFPDEYDFLIITPADFSDEFYSIDPEFDTSFIDYKNSQGISTKLVTLDEIYNGDYFPVEGKDDQEKIKYFIKNAIENWGITYVLLVGSGLEENEKFPVRYAYIPSGNYEKKFPSDLYYADIYDSEYNFSSWDDNDNGKYAEYSQTGNDMDAVDMYPDVYLGKLPCKDVNEVRTILKKILFFEKHNKMTNKIVQIGGDTFPGDPEDVNEGEFANEEVLEHLPGYDTTQLWASNGKLTKMHIANGFNNLVDFVDFSGHGSWGSWATHAPDDEHVWLPAKSPISPYTGWLYVDYEMYNVRNTKKFPVVVFNACSCSKYTDSANCIGWKTIKIDGGGIASFGASGIGYGMYGTHETERVWGWMEVHIFDELYNTKILGQVWSNAITGYVNSHISSEDWDAADCKTVLEMAMFGDPTLAIEDGEEPKIKSISNPSLHIFLEQLLSRFQPLERLLQLPAWVKSLSRIPR